MKHYLSILILSLLLLVACDPAAELGTPFHKGQEVTLTAAIAVPAPQMLPGKQSAQPSTSLPPMQRISGKDALTTIDLVWDEGDEIRVHVGEASSVFRLVDGAGTSQASFVGTMPANGSSYTVTYPIENNDDLLLQQTYVPDGIAKGLMKMSTSSPGTIDKGFTLSADHAVLGLQLTGSSKIGKIVLSKNDASGKAAKPSYTLNCTSIVHGKLSNSTSSGVTLTDSPTLFYIVLPAGIWEKGFTVEVYGADNTTIIDTFITNKRFEFTAANATTMAEKDVQDFKADVYMIPCYGQSLSTNTSAGASTFNYTEPLSYNTSLVNSNIQDMCAGTAEAFRLMADYYGITLPENFKIIGSVDGTGGASIAQLSKGTTYYNKLINSVKAAKTSCDAKGLTMCVPCFTWTQGEEEMRAGGNDDNYGAGLSYDPFTYKNRLKKLIDDLNTDIKAITGQKCDVLCISYQLASHNCYQRYPRIAMQMQELAEEYDKMILAKVMYDIEYVREGNASDLGTTGLGTAYEVHAYARSYRNMGNLYGIAAFNTCVLNQRHKWCYPINYNVNGNKINIRFDVPFKPLVLDTILINQLPDGNYGFNVYNVDEQSGKNGTIEEAETRITNVRLRGDDEVEITLSRTPVSGERLTYGINGDFWQNIKGFREVGTGGESDDYICKSGWQYGSRGCLRDSSPLKNNGNPSDRLKNLYNWCVIFEIEF